MRHSHSFVFALISICLAWTVVAVAGDGRWVSRYGGNWSEQNKWEEGRIANGSGYTAWFTADIDSSTYITLDSARTIGHLVFSDNDGFGGTWFLYGTTLTLATSGATPTVSIKTKLSLYCPLTGTQGVIFQGEPGPDQQSLNLFGDSSYTGQTIVQDCYLQISDDSDLGVPGAGNDTVVHDGATAYFRGISSSESFTITGNGYSFMGPRGVIELRESTLLGDITLAGNALIVAVGEDTVSTISGNISAGDALLSCEPRDSTLVLSGNLSGTQGLTKKDDDGTLALRGNNDGLSGTIHVLGGTLRAGTNDSIGNMAVVLLDDDTRFVLEEGEAIGSLAGSGTVDLAGYSLSTGYDGTDATFSGSLRGTGELVKIGDGVMTLNGSNTYSGETLVQEGTLRIADANERLPNTTRVDVYASGNLVVSGITETIGELTGNGTVAISDGGTLRVGGANATCTFDGTAEGDGTLAKVGTGTLTLRGNNSGFAGTFAVEAGTMQAGFNDSLGNDTLVEVGSNGTLQIVEGEEFGALNGEGNIDLGAYDIRVGHLNSDTELGGSLTGSGTLHKAGTGTMTLSGNYGGFTGALAVEAGTLLVTGSDYSGLTGALTVEAGTLMVTGSDERLPDTARVDVYPSGDFMVAGITQTIGQLTGAGDVTISGNGTLRVGGGDATCTFDGYIDGNGMLEKIDTGTLTLSGTNSIDGGTRLTGGVVSVSADQSLGGPGAELTFNGGTLLINSTSFSASNRPVVFTANGGTIETPGGLTYPRLGGSLAGSGDLTKTGTGKLTLTGDNGDYAGNIHIMQGTLGAGLDDSLGDATRVTIELGASLEIEGNEGWGSLAGAGRILLHGGDIGVGIDGSSTEYSGEIVGFSGYDFYKRGDGTLTLSGASYCDSNIYVEGGTLVAANDWACGGETVTIRGGTLVIAEGVALGNTVSFSEAGGTLAGNGTLASNLTLPTDSSLSPGVSAGIFTVNGNCTQQAGSTLAIEIGGTTPGTGHDQLNVTGTASLAGTLEITLIDGYELETEQEYVILTAGAVTGFFDNTVGLPENFAVTYNADSVVVSMQHCAPCDLDCDGDVDLADFKAFTNCMSGPDATPPGDCEDADLDTDADVDLYDYAEFQRAFTGS